MKKRTTSKRMNSLLAVILIMILSTTSVFAEEAIVSGAEADSKPIEMEAAETMEVSADMTIQDENEQTDPSDMAEEEEETDSSADIDLLDMSIELPESLIIKADTPTQVPAVINPPEAKEYIHWRSSNPSIIQVDENGVVTGLKRGTAVVSVAGGNVYSTCRVSVRFADVDEGRYYYDDVMWAVEKGITSGVTDIRFAPDDTCTRAQLVTFLWRYNGSPEPEGGSTKFNDIKSSDYFYKAVLWAYQNEIVSGVSDNQFAPSKTCTRGEAITFLWRCQRLRSGAAIDFTDVHSSDYYFYSVKWAVEKGITKGITQNQFAPANPVTRGQIVRFLHMADTTKSTVLDKSKWQIIYIDAEHVLDNVGHTLRAAFNWSASMPYYGHNRYMPDTAAPGIEWYANYGFKNKKGNCYVMAATFYEMAVNLGYKPRQMSGKVPLRVGGLGPHSWVEITINGTNYVFDPDFTESTGKNGYMIHYGQSGTWRYQSYSPMSR